MHRWSPADEPLVSITRAVALALPAALLCAVFVSEAGAQRAAAAGVLARTPASATVADTTDALEVDLLTVGQGDQVWEKFGHNSIVITDRRAGTSVAWNWGVFDFNQPNFIGRFLSGNTLYRMDGYPTDASIAFYQSLNRTVWIQRLALNAHYKRRLRDLILENARPGNREYRYEYFLDNCSTRIRNLLNEATGGGLAGWTRYHFGGDSYLSHTQRLVADNPFTEIGVTIALGLRADSTLTMWDEMFVPMKLQQRVRELMVEDGRGGIRPLVASERTLFTATRAAELVRPPRIWPWCLAIALVLGGLILALARATTRGSRQAQVALAAVGATWLTLAGIVGLILILAATLTRHVYWQDNPSAWLLNGAGLMSAAAFAHVVMRPLAGIAWRLVAALASLLSFVGVWQLMSHGAAPRVGVIALVMPVHMALLLVLVQLRRPRAARAGGAGPAATA